jgi:hypothetical protein
MGVCAYSVLGRCRVGPGLDVPGEREDLAATTPVHGPGMDFCKLFSRERNGHRLAGRKVVFGAETEGDGDRAIPAAVWQTQSRASWMFTTTAFRCSQRNLGLFAPALPAARRTYALSRFPQRSPGVGRKRQHVQNDNSRTGTSGFNPTHETVPKEDQPSSETSPLWQESARPINSDPAEGLRRLLMTRESLIVTRLAFC